MANEFSLIFQSEAQNVLDHFCGLFGIRIALFNLRGEEELACRVHEGCLYCQLLRKKLGLDARCRQDDIHYREEALKTEGMVSYTCHGGLREAVIPVQCREKTVGFLMIGQVRCASVLPKPYLQAWKKAGGGQELEEAFAKVPEISPIQLQSVLGMLEVLVNYIVGSRLVSIGGEDCVAKILDWIERHPRSQLSLGEAAGMVHRSQSTVSHQFRKTLGKSFRQARTDCKLDLAAELLKSGEASSVQEAAAQTGFDDPLYFSRLFKKHRGQAPSELLPKKQ